MSKKEDSAAKTQKALPPKNGQDAGPTEAPHVEPKPGRILQMLAGSNDRLTVLLDDGTIWTNPSPYGDGQIPWKQVRGPEHFTALTNRYDVQERLRNLLRDYDDEHGNSLLTQAASILQMGGIRV